MSEEQQHERRWIVEPPAVGEVSLYLAGGDGVTLTPEQEAALSALLRSLEVADAEVTGHAGICDALTTTPTNCIKLKCTKVTCGLWCQPLTAVSGAAAGSSGWDIVGSFSPRIG